MMLTTFCFIYFISSLIRFNAGISGTKYILYFNTDVSVADDAKSKEFIDTSGIMMEWLNETTAYLHGNCKLLKRFNENTMLEIKLEKEASGKREMLFSHEICDLCKELGDKDSKYNKYLKYIGFPDHCPFDAGEYPIHNFILDAEEIPQNSNSVGSYIATMSMYSNPSGDCKTNKEFLCSLYIGLTVEME